MCLSERCFAVGKLIAKAPWDRIFSMYKAATQDKKFDVKVPNLRACPTCKTLIINTANCKHTSCLCGESFCFVCLKKKIPQTGWPCGAAYEYCGFVAPNQSMNIIAWESEQTAILWTIFIYISLKFANNCLNCHLSWILTFLKVWHYQKTKCNIKSINWGFKYNLYIYNGLLGGYLPTSQRKRTQILVEPEFPSWKIPRRLTEYEEVEAVTNR